MRLIERDEKIIAVYNDIVEKQIDLKPDFQRGEVWSNSKKKLLVDSIFREWHIPPIHVVLLSNGKSEVLDGQQRLTAIRDFVENKFPIDGSIEPKDQRIIDLTGKKYRDLTVNEKRLFDRSLLKIYEMREYNQGEPSEFFYRLNQTVKLTSAEARNSIYGDVREDIKQLVDYMDEVGVTKNILGFSNSRMAYNDMLSRVCFFTEKQTLRATLNDSVLNEMYRDDNNLSERVLFAVKSSLKFLAQMQAHIEENELSLNLTKASSLNWLFLLSRIDMHNPIQQILPELTEAFMNLEIAKFSVKNNLDISADILDYFDFEEHILRELILIYIERSSSRVMSMGSLMVRDIILTISCHKAGIDLPLSEMDQDLLRQILLDLEQETDSLLESKFIIENVSDMWQEYLI
jgi:hypothetical protein